MREKLLHINLFPLRTFKLGIFYILGIFGPGPRNFMKKRAEARVATTIQMTSLTPDEHWLRGLTSHQTHYRSPECAGERNCEKSAF